MSSDFGHVDDEHPAALCIDGQTSTFCHAAVDDTNPWLSVQINGTGLVSYVVLHNRKDCCQDRLSPLQLWVGASVGDYNSATSASCGVDEVTLHAQPTNGPFSYRCADSSGQPLSGSYVTLVLPGANRTLNLAEIQVYASP